MWEAILGKKLWELWCKATQNFTELVLMLGSGDHLHKSKNVGQFHPAGLSMTTVSGREMQLLSCVWELRGPHVSCRVS